mgnify:CR=1 FL=1
MQSKTTRRTFVKGLAATGIIGGLGLWRTPVWAVNSPGQPNVLTGNEFDLFIGETPVNITGAARTAMTINGSLPGPILRWREGDTVTLRVRNRLKEDTSIHWHGIILPYTQDGVPGVSFPGIKPGETFIYRFTLNQSGTYWYHAHADFQEQEGLYGPLIISRSWPSRYLATSQPRLTSPTNCVLGTSTSSKKVSQKGLLPLISRIGLVVTPLLSMSKSMKVMP